MATDGWRARVWLNDVEVTDLCAGIIFMNERPEAVILFNLDDRGRFFMGANGMVSKRKEYGSIRVERLRPLRGLR
jgi:hypothetical protein